ncbi:MAG: hypothetical protein J6J62_07645 [Oscillospiraceae bacterium]|nr:hypothetical protein [Oscillospiraceae bacterium]
MKNFVAKLRSLIIKYEKPLIIILPCLAALISLLIIIPPLSVYIANRQAARDALPTAAQDMPQESAAPESDALQVYLSAYSTGEDMLISVCDAAGNPISGERFSLVLTTDAGDEIICSTYADGSCYLVELTPGIYTVTMEEKAGYISAEPVSCVVSSITHQAPTLEQLVPGLNEVDGRLYYLNELGEMATSIGLDLSCYNGRIEWDMLREQGLDYVILRVGGRGWGSGTVYEDALFREYFLAAKEVGLNVGVYFYSTATNVEEAIDEAEFVIDRLDGASLEMPIFLDAEYSGRYPYGRADSLNRLQRAEIINAFSATLRSCGYETGVYSGVYYLNRELHRTSFAGQTVWIANYTANNALPRVNFDYDIWQYTESGRVRGVFGPVDINVSFK